MYIECLKWRGALGNSLISVYFLLLLAYNECSLSTYWKKEQLQSAGVCSNTISQWKPSSRRFFSISPLGLFYCLLSGVSLPGQRILCKPLLSATQECLHLMNNMWSHPRWSSRWKNSAGRMKGLWSVLKKFDVPGLQNARGQASSNYMLVDHGDLVIQLQSHKRANNK